MAKDVDLTSREWTDIVFEGKNKEYGAYQLRQTSPRRHSKAIIWVLVVLFILVVALVTKVIVQGVMEKRAKEMMAQVDMTAVDIGDEGDMEEEEEMIQEIPQDLPEPEPEVQQEDQVTASQMLTELDLTANVDRDKEVDIDKAMEDTRVISNQDFEGLEDLNKEKVVTTVVEEKPKPAAPEGPVNMAMVEQKPQFPGGDAEMYKWLGNQIVYPPQAAEEGVSGKVTVSFIVEKDGSISNVTVVRGKHPALDKEAVRVVSKMPKWIPGKNNGAPVRVTYMLPVTFKLQN